MRGTAAPAPRPRRRGPRPAGRPPGRRRSWSGSRRRPGRCRRAAARPRPRSRGSRSWPARASSQRWPSTQPTALRHRNERVMASSTASSSVTGVEARPERLADVLGVGSLAGGEAAGHPAVELGWSRVADADRPSPMVLERGVALAVLGEPLDGERPDGLEQPVRARVELAHHEALVDERRQHHGRARRRPSSGCSASSASSWKLDGKTARWRSSRCSGSSSSA